MIQIQKDQPNMHENNRTFKKKSNTHNFFYNQTNSLFK